MTKPRDKLAGYRGIRPDALREAYRKQIDGEEEASPDSPYSRYVLGVAAEQLMAGYDADPEMAKQVLIHIVKRAEAETRKHMLALMVMPDLTTEEAKIAHHEARVAASIVTWLNEAIRSGHHAGRELVEGADEV